MYTSAAFPFSGEAPEKHTVQSKQSAQSVRHSAMRASQARPASPSGVPCVCVCGKKRKRKRKEKALLHGSLLVVGRYFGARRGRRATVSSSSSQNALLHGSLLVVGRCAPRRRNKPLVRGLRHGSNVTWRHGSTVTWFLSGRDVSARLLAPPLIPKD